MSDPLSDPRAADLLSAEPGEVWLLAALFRQVGSEAQGIAGALRGAPDQATWTGGAASAFRANVGQLPAQLDKVQQSYEDVASALSVYESDLADVKPAFQRLAEQLGNARGALGGAQGQLTNDQGTLTTALSAPHAKSTSPAVQSAHDAVQAASGTVSRLQGEVSGLEAQGFALLNRFQGARDGCQGKVSSACSLAPHQSWWDHVMSDVGNWMKDAGHFTWGVIDTAYHGVVGLPGAFMAFAEHPSWKTFEKFAEDVAITASIALLFCGVGEWLLPEECMVAGALDTASDVFDTVATGASLDSAGAEVGQGVEDGVHGNFSAMGADFADAALDLGTTLPGALGAPALGDALPGSIAADDAEDAVTAVKGYAGKLDGGLNEVQALRAMTSSEDRGMVLEAAGMKDGMTPAERTAFLDKLGNGKELVESAENSAKLANIKALPLKSLVNVGTDKFVMDPLVDHAKGDINQLLGQPAAG
jgi:uncharacterized protein YukE